MDINLITSVIGAVALVLAALISAKAGSRAKQAKDTAAQTHEAVERVIGVPNGKGNVMDMLERSLGNQEKMMDRQREYDERLRLIDKFMQESKSDRDALRTQIDKMNQDAAGFVLKMLSETTMRPKHWWNKDSSRGD